LGEDLLRDAFEAVNTTLPRPEKLFTASKRHGPGKAFEAFSP
jgi:hypothetical protein